MQGKYVIVTGATSGIGKEIAMGLGELGANLILAVRDIEKGQQVAGEIAERPGTREVAVRHMDASSQESIREFARRYRAKYDRLDVLVNNAGMNRGAQPRVKSVDGIELTFATNVLGYFLLTQELAGLLTASAPSRLVNVASTFASDVDLDDLEFERRPFEAAQAYAQSKACNRMLTWAFARRFAESGVTANAMAPGLVADTGLYRASPPELVKRLKQRSDRTSAQGADTAVWLASSADLDGVSGKFFYDREEVSCEFRNTAAEEKLWAICERLTSPKKR